MITEESTVDDHTDRAVLVAQQRDAYLAALEEITRILTPAGVTAIGDRDPISRAMAAARTAVDAATARDAQPGPADCPLGWAVLTADLAPTLHATPQDAATAAAAGATVTVVYAADASGAPCTPVLERVSAGPGLHSWVHPCGAIMFMSPVERDAYAAAVGCKACETGLGRPEDWRPVYRLGS